MPALSWAGEMLEVIWASRGLFMNRRAVQRVADLMKGKVRRDGAGNPWSRDSRKNGIYGNLCHLLLQD